MTENTWDSRDQHGDGGSDEPPVDFPTAGFFARLLWGVDAPVTDGEKQWRWAKAARDVNAILRAFR